jgi:hypothetical protein
MVPCLAVDARAMLDDLARPRDGERRQGSAVADRWGGRVPGQIAGGGQRSLKYVLNVETERQTTPSRKVSGWL